MELLIHMNNKIIQLIKYFIMIIKLCQLSQNPLKIEGFCPLIKNEQMGKNNKKKKERKTLHLITSMSGMQNYSNIDQKKKKKDVIPFPVNSCFFKL